jgi:hypothetical protein
MSPPPIWKEGGINLWTMEAFTCWKFCRSRLVLKYSPDLELRIDLEKVVERMHCPFWTHMKLDA